MSDIAAQVGVPDRASEQAARERLDLLAKPPGSLGRLEELAVWLCGVQGTCPPTPLDRVRVVVFAGDHGIAQHGVSAYPMQVTAAMVRAVVGGGAAVNVLARLHGAQVRVLDLAVDADLSDLPAEVTRHKVRRGSGSLDREDALTRDDAERAFEVGVAVADEEVDSGAALLIPGDMGIGNSTVAAALAGTLLKVGAADVVGRGSGIDDAAWMRKTAAIRDALRRSASRRHDPMEVLAAVGGADVAAFTGFLVQAAARRTPVLLDGVVSGACALVAQRIAPRARSWWLAGHRSTEPSHARALASLRLEPVSELDMRLGEGTGALMALPVLRAAGLLLTEMATLDDLGVPPSSVRPT